MRGSTIDVVSSRLIAGILALRRSLGLEQTDKTAAAAQQAQKKPVAAPQVVAPPQEVAPSAPVQPVDHVAATTLHFSAPRLAAQVNPSRQWIDFSMIKAFDLNAPRGTYLDIVA